MRVSPESRLRQWTQTANNRQLKGGTISLLGSIVAGLVAPNKARVVHILAETPSGPKFPASPMEVRHAG